MSNIRTSSRFTGLVAAFVLAPAFASANAILSSAADFTVLGGSAITSSASVGTVIGTGNVGLSVAVTSTIVGFPPGLISDGAIIETGAVTSQAGTDLIAAASYFAGLAADTNLTGTNLGGQTLAPGVYHFDSTAGLTGALILDAQGQNNASWVFQIGSALTTSASSSVSVINLGSNGGSDLNLFWNAGSAISIGASSVLAGNYLAGTSITVGAGSGGGARLLAQAAITLDQNQISAFGGPGGGDWTGAATVAFPEPASAVTLASLVALGFAGVRRRSLRIL
jgi:hypothetical protein